MADFSALKTAIQNAIKQNGNEEITGAILQEVMLAVVSTLGDSAINDLVAALSTEVTNRQNADGTLQTNIDNEATARGNADTALGTRFDNEVTARENADTALSNRITAITDAIDNGYVYAGIATTSTEPATGKVFYLTTATGVFTNFGGITVNTKGIKILKMVGSTWMSDTVIVMDDTPTENSTNLVKSGGVYASIASVLSKIAEGYLYVGIATAATNPSTPTTKVFYIATAAGTYTNFLDSSSQPLVLTQGINFLKYNGTSWASEQVWGVNDEPTPSSNNLVKSGGAFDFVMKNGSAFDLTAYNNGTTYADLNAALTALNALPAAFKKGGMSMKYVQTSDNKYMQCRCMAQNFTTDVAQWQGVDDEPTAGSDNLVKSGGVYETSYSIAGQIGEHAKTSINMESGVFVPSNVPVGGYITITDRQQNEAYRCAVIETKKGEHYIINAKGGQSPVAYVVLNSNQIVLSRASTTDIKDLEISIPSDGYLIINDSDNRTSYKENILIDLNTLETAQKDSIIGAINEVNRKTYNRSLSIIRQYDYNILIDGGYINASNGEVKSSDILSYTDYIDIEDIDLVEIAIPGSLSSTYFGGAVYDANKNYIQLTTSDIVHGANDEVFYLSKSHFPLNAKYIRGTWYSSDSERFVNYRCVLKKYTDVPMSDECDELKKNGKSSRIIYIAANNSSDKDHQIADYICDGKNDEVEINTAIASLITGGTIFFMDGDYYLDSFVNEVEADCYASIFFGSNGGYARTINIEAFAHNKGYNKWDGVSFHVTKNATDAMEPSKQYIVFGSSKTHPIVPSGFYNENYVNSVNFKNFYLFLNCQKPIIGIDQYYMGGSGIENVGVYSDTYFNERYSHISMTTPNIKSVGIRMIGGSNDEGGNNLFKLVNVGGLYKGYLYSGGDLIVMEACKANRCVYGYYFQGATPKTFTMINCSDEGCTHLPYFYNGGHITAIDFNVERFDSTIYPEDAEGSTEFYAEEGTHGTLRGFISYTLQGWSGADAGEAGKHFWKTGNNQNSGKNVETKNLDHKRAYISTDFPPVGEYLERVLDKTINKWYTWIENGWYDDNGNLKQ